MNNKMDLKVNNNSLDKDMFLKILSLKKVNKSIKRKINSINILYYISIILISFPIGLSILYKIEEIQNQSHHCSMFFMGMMLFYIMAIIFYTLNIYPKIELMRKEISNNNDKINEIKDYTKKENDKIESIKRFNRICNEIEKI